MAVISRKLFVSLRPFRVLLGYYGSGPVVTGVHLRWQFLTMKWSDRRARASARLKPRLKSLQRFAPVVSLQPSNVFQQSAGLYTQTISWFSTHQQPFPLNRRARLYLKASNPQSAVGFVQEWEICGLA